MQSFKEQQEDIRKPSSAINANKQRKRTEWERLEISSSKLDIVEIKTYEPEIMIKPIENGMQKENKP